MADWRPLTSQASFLSLVHHTIVDESPIPISSLPFPHPFRSFSFRPLLMPTAFLPPPFLPSTCSPPHVKRAPRCVSPSPSISRRAFLRLLITLPLLPSVSNAELSTDDELSIEPPFTPPRSPFRETAEELGELPHATHQQYLEAVRLGHPDDISNSFRILLSRTGVIAFVAAYSAAAMSISEREALRIRLPDKWDPVVVGRYFAIRPDKVIARFAQFGYEFSSFGARLAIDNLQAWIDGITVALGKKTLQWRQTRIAEREVLRARLLREGITRLGPAMIKLGQAASSRPDLFGDGVVRELQKLQDDVVGYYPTLDALRLIWDELDTSPCTLFEHFDTKPVAGASLGMVFKGVIDGENVAVKVQKPGVAEKVALDCYIVRGMATVAGRLLGSETNLPGAVDEYSSRLFEELDYKNEVRNITEFRRLYGSLPGIYLPKVYTEYSSKRVLVTEWIDGFKLIDEDCKVRTEDLPIVETGIQFALIQLLDKGFLHGDMHNGNMLRTKSGYLAFIDFGLVSEVPLPVRESIVCALMHLIHGEYARLAECFTGVALMRSDDIQVNLPLLSEALREVFEPPNQAVRAATFRKGVMRFNHFTLVGIVGKLLTLATRFPFVFNDYFLNNLRCLGMLEGLALSADPDFNVLGVVYPFVVKKILTDRVQRYNEALETLLIDSYGRLRWPRLDQLLQDVQDSAMSTSLGFSSAVTPLGISKIESERQTAVRRQRAEENKPVSPDLLLSFLTSPSGYFLREYIFGQYFRRVERYWRRRIDRRWGMGKVRGDPVLQATKRELSDEQVRVRTRQFFASTPWTKKCRAIIRLAPGLVLPFMKALLRVLLYAYATIVKKRKETGVRMGTGIWQKLTDTREESVSRWSIGKEETQKREWRAFDSDFLRRTQRNRLSSTS